MVDLPNDGANKGFWRVQLRDRFGKFVEMGGAVSFEVQLPGVDGVSRGLGYFIGNASLELARISVKDNLSVPKGIYEIAPNKITAIQAIIRRDQLVENPDGSVFARSTKATPTEPLKESMSGAEVQKKKLASITKTLKRKGRFAAPRQSNLDTWGKTSDVSVAAQEDYKQVYDSSPELQKLYDNAEDMWFRVFSLSVSTDTSSPNDLSQIPEEMKLLNREYAKHFLGLKEDGLITVYRNAVNGKDNEIDAAAGYVSTDMSLSYDYNSKKENIGANGRYEIDVKPDEVFGMLGYSQPEDEYAFVVGKGVTSQEGRVRRVGDLASLPMPAPWLDQYAKDISYARGATPYRHHALAGQFNFHEVENFGNDLKEFFAKYNLTADDIKSTFDRLYGSGAYEEYRESGNIVSFDGIRKMFVDLPNGNIGLDVTKISGGSSQGITFHSYGDASNPDSFKNDRLDNTLKMLAVFQELTGKPFFTHRSRDYVPTGDTKLVAPEIEPEISSPEIIESERKALAWYTDGGYWNANKNLRDGEPLDDDDSKELKILLDLISESTIAQDKTLYRGRPVINEERLAAINALKAGDFITDRGIMSTSNSKNRAKFYAEMNLEKVKGRVMFEIDVKAGQKGFEVPDEYSSYGDSEAEVLLPPNSRLEVTEVLTPDDGMKTIKLKIVESAATAEEKKTGLFQEYVPENRTDPGRSNAAEDTPLTELGFDPEQEIEVYRGVPEDVDSINPGDWVTTLPQLAKDYAGTGKVISKKVKAKDLLADPSSGEDAYTEEMVYRPTVKESESSILTPERAVEIWDSVLNERGAYEFDEDAADNELYDLMTEEGVSSKELAMANPVYRDYLKTLEFREKEDNSDHREWALDFLKNVRRSWNGNPKLSGLILAMQPVAKEVFGLQGTSNPIQELSSATKKEIADYTKFSKPALEAFLKASYKSTQKFFKDRGIETLVVYRGIINSSDNSYLTDPAEINVDVRPMSSWTVDPEIAKAYAPPGGILLRAEIPISQVLSTAFSGGMGTYVEREVVLLGSPEKIMGVVGSEYKKLLPGVQNTAKDTDMPGVIDVVDGVQRLQGKQSIFDKALTGEEFNLEKLDGSGQYAEDIEMFSKEEISVIKLYTEGVSYKTWNKYLRKNNAVELSKIKNDIDQLDLAIKEHGDVVTDSVVYRGNTFQSVPDEGRTDWAAILENLQVGDVLSDDAYMSTSNSPKIAYGSFAGGNAGFDYSTGKYKSNSDTQSNSLFWAITLPKGSTAMAVPDKVGFGQGAEEEVILPRGAQLRVIAIRRVEKEGEKGRYNYFLETEFIGAKPAEIELVKAPEGEGIPNVEG
jgi:hypothetical protein